MKITIAKKADLTNAAAQALLEAVEDPVELLKEIQGVKNFVKSSCALSLDPLPGLRTLYEEKRITGFPSESAIERAKIVKEGWCKPPFFYHIVDLSAIEEPPICQVLLASEYWTCFLGYIPRGGYVYNSDCIEVYTVSDKALVTWANIETGENFEKWFFPKELKALRAAYEKWCKEAYTEETVHSTDGDYTVRRYGTAIEFLNQISC